MATVLEQEDTTTTQQAAGPVPAAAPEKDKRGPGKKQKQAQATAAAPAVHRKQWGVPGFLRSPWLLLAAALMVGGFWLVLHPSVITDNLDKPYALLAGPALAGSFLGCWLIIKFFEAIAQAVRSGWAAFVEYRKQDAGAQFFWIVITVFLAVSVFASGEFFSKLEHYAVFGLLGYATALFIDLVAVQAMRARLNAGRLRDRRGQFLYLLGVLVCASASAFANVYTSLQNFTAPTGNAVGALPGWMSAIAPWFGLVFPLLIVLLSMTADYTVDQTSSKLDPESYKKEEGKRVKLLEYQRDLLKDRVSIEQEIDSLAAQLRGQKERRVFFLVAWLFPLQQSGGRILEQVEQVYKPQLEALTEQNTRLNSELARLANTAQSAYMQLDQTVQGFIKAVDSQRDTDNTLLLEQVKSLATPDYKALAEQVFPLLRQEVRTLAAATPAPKLKINYAELARSVAPLLATQQDGLKEVDTEEIAATNSTQPHQGMGDTDELQVSDIEALASRNGHTHEDETGETEGDTDELTNTEVNELIQQPTVSLEEAAQLLKCSTKYVRTLRDRHKIKATPRNRERFTTESINLYLAEKRQAVKA
jgi:uncharacterized membrane protein YhaH (DUF805 family)